MSSNSFINWIETRRSVSKLTTPTPNNEQIKQAIHCAMTAPDHRKLKPWRFIVTSGDSRQKLGKAFLKSALAQAKMIGETLDNKQQEKILNMPLRSPLIITVVTNFQEHEKVPKFEQILSTGACIQNLILALQAQGFASIWRTGLFANEKAVKDYFNVAEEDYIAGFIYVGTAVYPIPQRKLMDIDEFVKFED